MSNIKHGNQNEGDNDNAGNDHDHYWKRAHRDWRIWIGVILMLLAMLIYLMSNDLMLQPDTQQQSILSTIEK